MRGYAGLILGCYALFGALIAVNAWFLEQAREYSDINDIINEQERTYGLYNSLTHPLANYKLAQYLRHPALITAIGSSRSLQYRDYFFTADFYNMGGLVQGTEHALAMGRRVFAAAPPKVIIMTLDFWIFCSTFEEDSRGGRPAGNAFAKSNPVNRIMQPFYLMRRGALSSRDYWRVLAGDVPSVIDGRGKLGITAVLNDNGFGPDGSLFDFQRARDFGPLPLAERWRGYANAIETGASGFVHDCRLNPRALEGLAAFVDEMAQAGSRVVLIASPILPALIDAMAAKGEVYGYVDALWRVLDEAYDDFYNFHDPRELGSPPCEFLDEIHGGEVTHMRMLREIARDPEGALYGLIDTALLDKLIAANAGRMIVADNALGSAYGRYLAAQDEGECGAT